MQSVQGLKCVLCGDFFAPDEVDYVCPKHGAEGILDVVYDYGRIASQISPESLVNNRDGSIWRYKPLLPVGDD